MTAAALLNGFGYAFVMEAPGEEYAAAKLSFWQLMRSWRSSENPALAIATCYGVWVALGLLATVGIARSIAALAGAGDEETRRVSP